MTASLNLFEQSVLLYFAAFALCAAAITYIGSRAIGSRRKKASMTALMDLLANDYYESVSILVPAYNHEDTIEDTVRSLLNLQHPRFDITVVNDGSTDDTLERLVASFSLFEVPIAHDGGFETQPLNVMYRSPDHESLTVIDKDHGGRADALNAALNLARRTLVCVVDADVVLDPMALAAPSRRFVEDESVVAVTGLVRPDDEPVGGAAGWAERLQAIDHARRSAAAAGWAAVGAGMDVEGFVLYRRRRLLEIGGWSTPTDVETLLALHRVHRAHQQPYRVVFSSERTGYMQAERSTRGLVRWRGRRAQALAAALWSERRMLFRPSCGPVGLVVIPLRWMFDVASPFIEAAAYVYIVLSAALGTFEPAFAIGSALLTVGSRVVLGQLATASDAVQAGSAVSDRIGTFAATVVEQLGIAQLSILASIAAIVRGTPTTPSDNESENEAPVVQLAG